MNEFPERLQECTQRYFGPVGLAWLEGLSALIDDAARRWALDLGEVSPDAGTGFVCFARDARGGDVVLKIAFPHDEHFTGAEALRVWNGGGCVRLLDATRDDSQLLMERVLPGRRLGELNDEEAEVPIAAGVMRRLHVPPPDRHRLPPFHSWVDKALRRIAAADVGERLMPRRLVRALEETMAELDALNRTVVLHGDLHHENILQGDPHWVAIDPKGLTGDPALDIGRYCGNQLQRAPDLASFRKLVDRRVEIFAAELGEPVDRLRRAAAVDRIMCMGWDIASPSMNEEDFMISRDHALHLVS